MKFKRFLSVILILSTIISILPINVFASTKIAVQAQTFSQEYYSLKDIAEVNGYECFYYDDNDTMNMRSASYILAFQNDNSIVAYKTVLGDVGTIELNSKVIKMDGTLCVSKTDAQTKLIKYFPNTPSNIVEYSAKNIVGSSAPSPTNASSYSTPQPTKNPTSTGTAGLSNTSVIIKSNSTSSSKPSDWADSEVNDAIKNNLVTENVKKDYQDDISREYFCELVMKLYEKITKESVTASNNIFNDTSNPEILKAYKLGIVKGISSTEFAPKNLVTRQEICTMLVRAIGAMYKDINTADYQYHSFNDSSDIASWAMDSVQFAFDNNIMQGVGGNKIDPLGNATCEQAILLVNRIYNNRSQFEHEKPTEKPDDKEDAVMETLKRLDFDDDSEVNGVSVSFTDNSSTKGVRIKEIDSDDLIYTTTGIKGSAVNITSSKKFDKAVISFDYNPSGLGGTNPNDLAVGWYNTDLDRVEILESKVDTVNHTVSVETTHFSEYILVDSKEWYSVWQRGQTIVRKTDKDGNNAENFNVQLVVDCSGSMSEDRMSKAKECTYNFIEKLSENDKFSVIRFDDLATTIVSVTAIKDANMTEIKNNIMALYSYGGTNFDAALNECLNTIDTSGNYNNIIAFLSDGESSVDDSILSKLNNNGVKIASIALGNGSSASTMQRLSDATNGQYVFAENSSDLDAIYSAIQGSLIGVDATDTDGDGIPDIVEINGMKNQYSNIIRTDPNLYDTDGDGKSDGEEMGKLIETDEVTEMDKKRGINSCVYFEMVSDPVEGHKVSGSVNLPEMSSDEIKEAIKLGLVPDELQNDIQKTITRLDFCNMVMKLYNNVRTNPVVTTADERYSDIDSLSSAEKDAIGTAEGLGIINGYDDSFRPYDELSRQDAAVMIMNTARAFNLSEPLARIPSDYIDCGDLDSKTLEGVKYVCDAGLISEVDEQSELFGTLYITFKPKDVYTRDQAIRTFYRLYNKIENKQFASSDDSTFVPNPYSSAFNNYKDAIEDYMNAVETAVNPDDTDLTKTMKAAMQEQWLISGVGQKNIPDAVYEALFMFTEGLGELKIVSKDVNWATVKGQLEGCINMTVTTLSSIGSGCYEYNIDGTIIKIDATATLGDNGFGQIYWNGNQAILSTNPKKSSNTFKSLVEQCIDLVENIYNDEIKAIAKELTGFESISDFLGKKLSNKLNKKAISLGLGDINKFIGECNEMYNLAAWVYGNPDADDLLNKMSELGSKDLLTDTTITDVAVKKAADALNTAEKKLIKATEKYVYGN